MRHDALIRTALILGALWLAPRHAPAQNDEDGGSGYSAILDNIDLLIDNYGRFLARQYSLNEEQDAFTREMLRERAHQFLDQHETEVRSLVDRMFSVRTGADMAPEELIDWGKRAMPLYEEAKKLIIQGNDDWRQILTDEQKATHDEVLKHMYESFETTEQQLDAIVTGNMTVEEFRNPRRFGRGASARNRRPPQRASVAPTQQDEMPPPEPGDAPPPEPPQVVPMGDGEQPPAAPPGEIAPPRSRGRGGDGDPASDPALRREDRRPNSRGDSDENGGRAGRGDDDGHDGRRMPRHEGRSPVTRNTEEFAGRWQQYVDEFIQRYGLNDEQSQQARSILADCQAQADRHVRGHKAQIERIDARLAELRGNREKDASKETSELNAQKAKMIEPIDQIFERSLKPRLERLPSRAQRRAAEAADAAKRRPSAASSRPVKKDEP